MLIRLSLFEGNSLLKAVFDDNSSIIVHPSFKYITYFHFDNTKIKLTTENLTKMYNINEKVKAIINVIFQSFFLDL